VYLIVNNERIQQAIDTLGKKAVLLLGRFTGPGWDVLQTLKAALRSHRLLPMLFTFKPSERQSRLDTVETLARLSRLVIAEITDPRAVIGELVSIENIAYVPKHLFIREPELPDVMLDRIRAKGAEVYAYKDIPHLLSLLERVLMTAEVRESDFAKRLSAARGLERP
jgi:hypothetical protein